MAARILPFFGRPGRGATERAFLPAALEIVETPASPTLRISAALISLFLLLAVGWSYFGRVDIVATAPGKVIARERTKIIQPSDTGQVREIDVTEGQHVIAGQVLIKLDPTMAKADEARFRDGLLQAKLDRARLQAELAAGTGDPFAGLSAPPDLIATARARLVSELRQQEAKVAKIDEEIAQKKAERAEIDAAIAKIDAALPYVQARADIRRAGVITQFGSKLDYYQQQQQLVEMQHDRLINQRKGEAVDAELSTLTAERAEAGAQFRASVFADITKADREIAENEGELAKATRRFALQTLTAPVSGVVQELSVHTLGGVVTPAEQLLRIVPDHGGIEVEAVIANQDVGFVAVGQKAEIKVDAFPFTRYGLLHGWVREVSRDAIDETAMDQHRQGTLAAGDAAAGIERSRTLVYTARIVLDHTDMMIDGRRVNLQPGMAVIAEIKTGRRRVLDFLLSPFHRYSHDALRER